MSSQKSKRIKNNNLSIQSQPKLNSFFTSLNTSNDHMQQSDNKVLSIDNDYVACPCCDEKFPISNIELHANSCFEEKFCQVDANESNKTPIVDSSRESPIADDFADDISNDIPNDKSKNAFNILMSSKKRSLPIEMASGNDSCIRFALIQTTDGTILPILTLPEEVDEIEFETKWSHDVKIRSFIDDLAFRDTSQVDPMKDLKIRLVTNIPMNQDFQHGVFATSSSIVSAGLLKSMIQKSVRRRNVDKVINLSYEMIRVSMSDFLRRLPIICLEDGLLHPCFPIVIWIMIAESKGYRVPEFLIRICIAVLADVAICELRDSFNPLECKSSDLNSKQSLWQIPNKSCRILLFSILARQSYGGMSGDINMLYEYACLWNTRFQNQSIIDNNNVLIDQNILLSTVSKTYLNSLMNHNPLGSFLIKSYQTSFTFSKTLRYEQLMSYIHLDLNNTFPKVFESWKLQVSDFASEGIDFHCDWQIISFICNQVHQDLESLYELSFKTTDKVDKYSIDHMGEIEKLVKSAIWIFRSSVNFHHLWNDDVIINNDDTNHIIEIEKTSLLEKKKSLLPIWKLISTPCVYYCNRKIADLEKRLERNV